jgi:hypothetical protein
VGSTKFYVWEYARCSKKAGNITHISCVSSWAKTSNKEQGCTVIYCKSVLAMCNIINHTFLINNRFTMLLASTLIILSMYVSYMSDLPQCTIRLLLYNGTAKEVFTGQKTFHTVAFLLQVYTTHTVCTIEKCYF